MNRTPVNRNLFSPYELMTCEPIFYHDLANEVFPIIEVSARETGGSRGFSRAYRHRRRAAFGGLSGPEPSAVGTVFRVNHMVPDIRVCAPGAAFRVLWCATPFYTAPQQSTSRVPLIAAQFNEGKLRKIIHDGKFF